MEIATRPLTDVEWPAARSLMHRAFIDEPFNVEMYGENLLTRWAGSWALYQGIRRDEYAMALGAWAGQVIVGALVGSLPGHCHVCDVVALTPPAE